MRVTTVSWASSPLLVGLLLHSSPAQADGPDTGGVTAESPPPPSADSAPKGAGNAADDAAAKSDTPDDRASHAPRNRFAGSIVLFDQSMTVDSFSRSSRLSYSPTYELWLSPRVYYSPIEHLKVGARFDFFRETFTNHVDETTDRNEIRVGDPWLTASYSAQAKFVNRNPLTRWAVGAVVRPPLSKNSRADGQYVALGPTASATFGFYLAGQGARWFPSGSVGLSAQYTHAFTRATTPVTFGSSFGVDRTNVAGGLTRDDQVRSSTLSGDSVLLSLSATVDIRENLTFSTSYILIDRFSYTPPEIVFQGETVPRSPNDTRLRQLGWFIASVGWTPIRELEVSLGYYNLNNTLGLDGRYRNPFFSPEERVFLSLTANLDALYDDATKSAPPADPAPQPLRTTTTALARPPH